MCCCAGTHYAVLDSRHCVDVKPARMQVQCWKPGVQNEAHTLQAIFTLCLQHAQYQH